MKSEERLLKIMEGISDDLLVEALETKQLVGGRVGRGRKILLWVAAAACIFLLFLYFIPAGQAVAARLQERIGLLLEEWFPPREITATPEGTEETGLYESYGRLPDQGEADPPGEQPDAGVPGTNAETSGLNAGVPGTNAETSGLNAGAPGSNAGIPGTNAGAPGSNAEAPEAQGEAGFVIYYDAESYEAVEDGNRHIIRPKRIGINREEVREGMSALLEGLSEEEAERRIDERIKELQSFYDSLPSCEIWIVQREGITAEEAAREARQELLERYEYVAEVEPSAQPEGLHLYGYEGTASDAEVRDVYFVNDGSGGVFTVTAKYFMEAAEGHGVRLRAMINTFEVLLER